MYFKPSFGVPLPAAVRGASPKSKMPARSTKKGSSLGPQKTLSPVEAVVIALFTSVL